MLSTPATLDGTEIESTDDLVAAFRTAGTEITEIEPTTVGGIESRVFEMRGEASEVLKRGVDDERTYARRRWDGSGWSSTRTEGC